MRGPHSWLWGLPPKLTKEVACLHLTPILLHESVTLDVLGTSARLHLKPRRCNPERRPCQQLT